MIEHNVNNLGDSVTRPIEELADCCVVFNRDLEDISEDFRLGASVKVVETIVEVEADVGLTFDIVSDRSGL